jgi:hypothetical protein
MMKRPTSQIDDDAPSFLQQMEYIEKDPGPRPYSNTLRTEGESLSGVKFGRIVKLSTLSDVEVD